MAFENVKPLHSMLAIPVMTGCLPNVSLHSLCTSPNRFTALGTVKWLYSISAMPVRTGYLFAFIHFAYLTIDSRP